MVYFDIKHHNLNLIDSHENLQPSQGEEYFTKTKHILKTDR